MAFNYSIPGCGNIEAMQSGGKPVGEDMVNVFAAKSFPETESVAEDAPSGQFGTGISRFPEQTVFQ